MAVLINGMKMPKEPDEWIEIVIFGHGMVIQTGESWRNLEDGKYYYKPTTPEKFFNAVHVQPHGDLIDRDALIEDLKRQCKEVFRIDAVSPDDYWIIRDTAYNQRLWQSWCEGFYEYVGSRPTIIPADGKDTNVPTREEEV